jgi:hypothetical protein
VTQQKPLSDKQAFSCERATQPVCKCRCGGVLHGAKRGGTNADGTPDRTFFEALPTDDPHYLPNEEIRQRQQAERKAAVQRKRKIIFLERTIGDLRSVGAEFSAAYYERELAALKGDEG